MRLRERGRERENIRCTWALLKSQITLSSSSSSALNTANRNLLTFRYRENGRMNGPMREREGKMCVQERDVEKFCMCPMHLKQFFIFAARIVQCNPLVRSINMHFFKILHPAHFLQCPLCLFNLEKNILRVGRMIFMATNIFSGSFFCIVLFHI